MARVVRVVVLGLVVLGLMSPVPVAAAEAPEATAEQTIRRLYLAVFEREPDPAGLAHWVGVREGGTALEEIATAFTDAPEFQLTYGSLGDEDFVALLYTNVLGRPADVAGTEFWLAEMRSGLSRGSVVLWFSEGQEFRDRTFDSSPVERLYCAFFLRPPDEAGRAHWVEQYRSGALSLPAIAGEFSTSPEFAQRYGELTDTQFVHLVYRNVLGRDLPLVEVEGPRFWRRQLLTSVADRGEVMVGFSESEEYRGSFVPGAGCPSAGSGELASLPGADVDLFMAQAEWRSGHFHPVVIRRLLLELGYQVNDPADATYGPSLAYLAMAHGEVDFWANSWYPGHYAWHGVELRDGSLVGDRVTVVGEQMIGGGAQGFVMTKAFADRYGVYTLDDLEENPDALAAFDEADPIPGNGIADIYGCQASWTCDEIIDNMIAFSGWNNIRQVVAGYDAMVAEAVWKANTGQPMVIYLWSPSACATELTPGDNVYWLGMDDVLDDSNPTAAPDGARHDQRPGTLSVGPDLCPSAVTTCQTGWASADILVTANRSMLEAHPAAASLLEQFAIGDTDVSHAVVRIANGCTSSACIDAMAAEWIAANLAEVDTWLAEAMEAS